MTEKQDRVRELEAKIEALLPAHSAKPWMFQELEVLEEALEEAVREAKAEDADQAGPG